MGNLRTIVGISLAVAIALGLVAYLLVPHAGPKNESIVVNPPQAPTNGDTGGGSSSGTPGSGGSGSGGSGGSLGGTAPSTPPTDHVRPPKPHGRNSEGPKHPVCLPGNPHVQGNAQYQGANWYRGTCAATTGAEGHGHAYGHGHGDSNGHAHGPAQGSPLVAPQARSDKARGH